MDTAQANKHPMNFGDISKVCRIFFDFIVHLVTSLQIWRLLL